MDSKILFQENKIRNECKRIAKQLNPDYFITLTFRDIDVSEHFSKDSISKFLNMVNREIFGRHSNEKMNIMVIQEKNSSCGIHYHLLACDPAKRSKRMQISSLRDIFKSKWAKIKYGGFHDLDELNDQWFKKIHDLDGVVKYVTKTVKSDTDPVDWELSNIN